MIELTIAQVAGLINVGVIVVQFTFPLALVFVLIGILKNQNNAITWSVVGRLVNGSSWPVLLGSDSAASTKVSKRSLAVSTFSTGGLLLLAIAAAVTPLGLYEVIAPVDHEETIFAYSKDTSPIGEGTPARDEYKPDRLCGSPILNCPGQGEGFSWFTNASGSYVHWDEDAPQAPYISSVIPENLTRIFSSGSTGDRATVASIFDIQYRTFFQTNDPDSNSTLLVDRVRYNIDQQRKRTEGTYQSYQSQILEDGFVVIEGAVLDMAKGGIGFRNHTIPLDVRKGTQWTEALLWIEPETVCVDTNLTIDYSIENVYSVAGTAITDRGGFAHLTKEYPFINLNDTQNRPELHARAYKGAVLNNYNLLVSFNQTRNSSYVGKSFPLSSFSSFKPTTLQLVRFSPSAGAVIPGSSVTLPVNFNDSQLVATGIVTRGFGSGDSANITNLAVDAGILLGGARRVGGDGSPRMEPGTNWTAPMFSCVTAVKSYIMDVTFFINGSSSLENLKVVSAKPQIYDSNATTPLWGVENAGMNLSDVGALWGLVDDRYEKADNMWTIRKDSIYLPASKGSYYPFASINDAVAGANAPQSALYGLYNEFLSTTGSGMTPDYTGGTSYPLYLRWRNLSNDASTASSIINIIYTDFLGNYLMGSRSLLNANQTYTIPPAEAPDSTSPILVQRFDRQIKYHLKYAIPIIVFLGIYLLVLATALVMWILRRSTFTMLRSLLNQTAVGRAVTMERHKSAKTLTTKEWIDSFGAEDVGISKKLRDTTRDSSSQSQANYEPVEDLSYERPKNQESVPFTK